MREDLADLRSHVNNLSSRVDNGFAEMRGKLDAAAAGQEQIARLLSTLIQRETDRTTASSTVPGFRSKRESADDHGPRSQSRR